MLVSNCCKESLSLGGKPGADSIRYYICNKCKCACEAKCVLTFDVDNFNDQSLVDDKK